MKTIKIIGLIIINLLIIGFVIEYKNVLIEYKVVIFTLIIGLIIISYYATKNIFNEDKKSLKS